MAGKRKLIRQRASRKTRAKNNDANLDDPSRRQQSFGFTKEEEEEPLSVHIKPSPKKSPRNKRAKTKEKNSPIISDFAAPMETKEEGVKPANNDGKEISMGAEIEGDSDENEAGEEEHRNKFEVRQRVLARDEDGILYYANIRRTLYGINHQKTISCLSSFDLAPDQLTRKETDKNESERDIESTTDSPENEWHYFVHYEGWKALFDRWVSEKDILEITPENVDRMKEITKAHKAFQLEFKEKTRKRKIQNGNLFLQQWKQRLDVLNRRWKDDKQNGKDTEKDSKKSEAKKKRKAAAAAKKKNGKSPEEVLRDRSKLAVKSCLTTRQASHIQAIPLSFALKRILVEDWENLNNASFAAVNSGKDSSDENLDWDMVHVLPAKVTIRDALTLYLKEKGILWEGRFGKSKNREKVKVNSEKIAPTKACSSPKPEEERPPATLNDQTTRDFGMPIAKRGTSPVSDKIASSKEESKEEKEDGDEGNGNGISIQLIQEWTDMADGIVLYFEQALKYRLLYPSEISQLLVLEDCISDDKGDEPIPLKVDIYGCEHLLRLLSSIPRILDQQLQESRKRKTERKQHAKSKQQEEIKPDEDEDKEDAFVEIGSMILAKLQDLSRFLQKNQSALFRSMYRKKNEDEIKRDIKIQKRLERRLKSLAAATATSSQNREENI